MKTICPGQFGIVQSCGEDLRRAINILDILELQKLKFAMLINAAPTFFSKCKRQFYIEFITRKNKNVVRSKLTSSGKAFPPFQNEEKNEEFL